MAIVGQKYGSVFEIGKGGLRLLPGQDHLRHADASSASLSAEAAEGADNRDLIDANTSQKLTDDDIKEMRSGGASGSEIIEALVQNSDSWHTKTQFSQQKWLARKEQKYTPRLRLCRCDAASVCEAYYQKHREKMCNLRSDSLAQILAFGNVYSGVQVTVFDTCMGLVVSSVLERLGGRGRVLAPYAGSHPAMDANHKFNFSEAVHKIVHSFHTSEIGISQNSGREEVDDSEEAIAARTQKMIEDIPAFAEKKLASLNTEAEKTAYMERRNARIKKQCAKPQPATIRNWIRDKSDSLIIVTHFHPTSVLLNLLPTLAPSAPFVVFSEYIEPLVECFREVQKRCIACKLQLSNTWTREYQVLPGRTHPAMNMSACSGYILTGIKVQEREDGWQFVDKVQEKRKKAKVMRRADGDGDNG